MTSLERVSAALDGRVPDRVPVGLHNYLMACRTAGVDLREVLRDGEALAEVQLQAWREFGHDLIQSENGVCAEAEAMGCGVSYQRTIAPRVEDPVVKTPADIDKLRVPDPEKDFPLNELLKTTRVLVRETGDRVFINGRSDQGPMALAAALCGPENFLLMAADPALRPKVLQLLDLCSRTNIALGEAQRRAGAHGTCIGVYGTTLVSPAMFDALEFPRVRAFCGAMRACGPRPFIHLCGRETRLLGRLVETGAECLELDPLTDPQTTKQLTGGRLSIFGMLNPTAILCRGSVAEVERHTREILNIMAPGGGFILGPGCALPEDTPPANLHAVMECARTLGIYRPDGALAASV